MASNENLLAVHCCFWAAYSLYAVLIRACVCSLTVTVRNRNKSETTSKCFLSLQRTFHPGGFINMLRFCSVVCFAVGFCQFFFGGRLTDLNSTRIAVNIIS